MKHKEGKHCGVLHVSILKRIFRLWFPLRQVSWQIVLMVRYSCELETYIVAVERIKEYSEVTPEVGYALCLLIWLLRGSHFLVNSLISPKTEFPNQWDKNPVS